MTTGEGTRVKKVLAAILLAIGGMMAGAGALAQVQMDVYFTANAMERETAERLMELTRRAFPQAQWNCRQAEDEESDLRALILADDVPEIVVCAPGEANLWVSDGLFAALDGRVTDADRDVYKRQGCFRRIKPDLQQYGRRTRRGYFSA